MFSIFKDIEVCRSTTVASGSTAAGPVPDEDVEPLVSISDCTGNTKAMVLGFIADSSLPLSLVSSLTKLVQASRDPQTIANLALSKQTGANKMNFGLGKTFTDELVA